MRAIMLFFCIFLTAENISTSSIDVAKAFKCSKIKPDVTPCVPRCLVQVQYADDVYAKLGNMITPSETAEEPSIDFIGDELSYYTLAMIDPDVPIPSNTSRSQIVHWIVGNIPGDDVSVSSGETLADYIGTGPPEGSGAHRYVFLVYLQNAYIRFNETRLDAEVTPERFVPISVFVEKYELGCPVFGNFFLAQYEEDAE